MVGEFYSPEYVFNRLDGCAKKFGYNQLRISGNEPTLGRDHLFRLLELIDQTSYSFILETNGILIGYDSSYAKKLSKFRCIHVRVSIKGITSQEYCKLTGAKPESFNLQLKALKNLLDAGVSCHPAVMLSFSLKENFPRFLEMLKEIEPKIVNEVEEEYVFLYPHVVRRLKKAGVNPKIAYQPNRIPENLI